MDILQTLEQKLIEADNTREIANEEAYRMYHDAIAPASAAWEEAQRVTLGGELPIDTTPYTEPYRELEENARSDLEASLAYIERVYQTEMARIIVAVQGCREQELTSFVQFGGLADQFEEQVWQVRLAQHKRLRQLR